MAGIATKKRLARQKREREIAVLKRFAESYVSEQLGNADGLELLLADTDDGWEHIREKIIEIGAENGDWAGYPLPIEHAKLCVKPTDGTYGRLDGMTFAKPREADAPDDYEMVNCWVDRKSGLRVFIVKFSDGRIRHGFMPSDTVSRRFKFILDTMAASQAWSLRAEFTALARLKTLVSPAAFRYYVLTGTFIETSPRSKMIYMFRKCRPTVVIAPTLHGDDTRVLTTLCLHPIGYYENTYAGSMVPTDDVIAHLLLMRGDEHKYWAHANQHEPGEAEAGI